MLGIGMRVFAIVVGSVFLAIVASGSKPAEAIKHFDPMVRLPGHVLPALAEAKLVPPTDERTRIAEANQPLLLTIVLKRDKQPEFDRYLRDLYDSHSPPFHDFLTHGSSQIDSDLRIKPAMRSFTTCKATASHWWRDQPTA